MAELWRLREGLIIARRYGFEKLIVEVDSKAMVHALESIGDPRSSRFFMFFAKATGALTFLSTWDKTHPGAGWHVGHALLDLILEYNDTYMMNEKAEELRRQEAYDEGNKLSYVEYKSLKKVLKRCSACNTLKSSNECCSCCSHGDSNLEPCDSSAFCDQTFFPELKKEASDVAGCFSSRVRRLLRLHMAPGVQQYFISLRHCFVDDQQAMARECQMLMQYAVMNTTAMRKILKKYDKIHGSVKGRNFKSTISAEHLEILQSPWLIELGAFYLNFNAANGKSSRELFSSFPCDFDATEFTLTLTLPENIKLEYSLKCAVCLDFVFNPYALGCGHLFCKSCACRAASVMIYDGLKAASKESKCPICRQVGVYTNVVHMVELDLLLKRRFRKLWKERLVSDRAEALKQSRLFWELQTRYNEG
nr:probable E3 ubiquitin-protein ligase BAH1-like [Ipomoea batatas]